MPLKTYTSIRAIQCAASGNTSQMLKYISTNTLLSNSNKKQSRYNDPNERDNVSYAAFVASVGVATLTYYGSQFLSRHTKNFE